MNIYAVVKSGIVVNRVRAAAPRDDTWIASKTARIGWLFDGAAFADPGPPPPVVPRRVRLRKLLLALLDAGQLTTLKTAVSNLGPAARARAEIELQAGGDVPRNGVFAKAIGNLLSLTDAQIDALFIAAEEQPE